MVFFNATIMNAVLEGYQRVMMTDTTAAITGQLAGAFYSGGCR